MGLGTFPSFYTFMRIYEKYPILPNNLVFFNKKILPKNFELKKFQKKNKFERLHKRLRAVLKLGIPPDRLFSVACCLFVAD